MKKLLFLKKTKDFIKNKGLKKTLPLIYLFLILLGFVLTIVYAFVPSFVACSSMFGRQFCTPIGIFVALIVSLPGYIIAGNVLSFIEDLHWAVSLAVVFVTSALFYYLLGLFIDNLKGKSLNPENLSKIFVTLFFAILLLLVIALL